MTEIAQQPTTQRLATLNTEGSRRRSRAPPSGEEPRHDGAYLAEPLQVAVPPRHQRGVRAAREGPFAVPGRAGAAPGVPGEAGEGLRVQVVVGGRELRDGGGVAPAAGLEAGGEAGAAGDEVGAAEEAGDVVAGVGGVEVGEAEGDVGEDVGVGVAGAGVGVEGGDAVAVVAGLLAHPLHDLRRRGGGGRADGEGDDGDEEAEERGAWRWQRRHFLGATVRGSENVWF